MVYVEGLIYRKNRGVAGKCFVATPQFFVVILLFAHSQ